MYTYISSLRHLIIYFSADFSSNHLTGEIYVLLAFINLIIVNWLQLQQLENDGVIVYDLILAVLKKFSKIIFAAKGDCKLSARWVNVDEGHEMAVLYNRPVRSFKTAWKQCRFHCGYLVAVDKPEDQSTLESFLRTYSEFYHSIVYFCGVIIS